MHLKQLKLAGFKSFVDPTVVPFPSQLLAVVGPNGCGKSNIIDAVRWVMGESSAKNLRGESMTDVIFNGSSNRKPVGQASVELVFDNSLGRLIGPFASYGEIALKRIVTRDGDSSYYLNGSRCRRKDITDIFLGTGAGSRGYSIIGQGTISRLIEAKPEELRVFLEEAAGVSKYKERRRETLQRIGHTQENLTRVADIRDELDKQLQRLERQAKSAERYTHLKEEEHLCRAEILALKWQDFTRQQLFKQRELQEFALQYEQHQSIVTHAHSERTLLNEQLYEANDQAQTIQAVFYQLGTEIARLEETIQQQEREKMRLEHDKQQMQHDWQSAEEQLKQDQEALQNSQQHAQDWEQKVAHLQRDFGQQEMLLHDEQQQKILCETRWQEGQNTINGIKSELQIAQVMGQHLEQRRQQIVLRMDKLNAEHRTIFIDELQQQKIQLTEQLVQLNEAQSFDEEQVKQSNERCNQLRVQLQDIEHQLHQTQDDFHRLNSEHAALSAAQKAAKQSNQGKELIQWSDKSKLMDVLRVEAPWQAVCEMVLNEELHAYVLDDLQELWPQWALCEKAGASVVTMRSLTGQSSRLRLADKIQSAIPHTRQHLEHIFIAEHLDEAISWLPELNDYESVVTVDGFWLGKGWVKLVNRAEHDEMGLLARQQKIAELRVVVNDLQDKIECVRTQRDEVHLQLQQSISYSELHQINLCASNEGLRELNAALHKNEQEIVHAEKLKKTLLDECSELHDQLEETVSEQMESTEKINQVEQQYHLSEQQQEELTEQKQQKTQALRDLNEHVAELRTVLHQAELDWDRELSKTQQLTERINREQERLDVLQERLEHIALLCLNSLNPQVDFQHQLTERLGKHTEVESQLISSREQVSQLRMRLEDLEKNSLNFDASVKKVQDAIAQTRMQEHELAVRASAIQESLDELKLQAEVLLETIPPEVTQSIREDELLGITEKIKRLGAINLAAIEEFGTEQQRKQYLDEQYNDLTGALVILETAIEQMDKETRSRLENTFNEVNTSFKALFPRLFGGGRAQLELTCDNLLEAGIVVMAQPPGKRNSTIHLLSGGEKAMTAVALVFAIFQLNPSPFCMLDEVDAPLDDVNVGRFCDLVKEMSQFVQFLFITHNKVTMELADHLIGVTMREPGVSRLVAVDVQEALTME